MQSHATSLHHGVPSEKYSGSPLGNVLVLILLLILIIGMISFSTSSRHDGSRLTNAKPDTIPQGSGLNSTLIWSGESNQNMSLYGQSVAAGDFNHDGYSDVSVGAPQYTPNPSLSQAGRVYVYYGSIRGTSPVANWTMNGAAAGANFGCSIAIVDINRDGYSDLIVGAPDSTSPTGNSYGHVHIFNGGPNGLSTSPDWTVTGGTVISQLGLSVAGVGSVNGNGYQDVLVGAPGDYNPSTGRYTGTAYLYYGSAKGPSTIPSWKAGIPDLLQVAGANYAFSLGSAGDLNHDGYMDIVVGAPNYDVTSVMNSSHEGKVFVYYGSSTGLSNNPSWTAVGNTPNIEFGYSVASGDFNGDGYSDLVIGSPCEAELCTSIPASYGQVLVYDGSNTGLGSSPSWVSNSGQIYSAYGYSVSSAGDVNGDGYNDIVIGAPYYTGTVTGAGRILAYYGSTNGLSSTPNWTSDGNQASSNFGLSVARAGDVNNDGVCDIIVGATRHRSTSNNSIIDGWAGIFPGNAPPPQPTMGGPSGGIALRQL